MTTIAHSARQAIEQARARGLSIDETADTLGVEPGEVRRVWATMDALASDDRDVIGNGNRRHKLARCGTPSAYARHRRYGEPVDEACREGIAKRSQDYRHRVRMRAS